jgi:hypothetical protein
LHCAQGNDDVPEPLHRGQTPASGDPPPAEPRRAFTPVPSHSLHFWKPRPLQKLHFSPLRVLPLPLHCAQGKDAVPEPLHFGHTPVPGTSPPAEPRRAFTPVPLHSPQFRNPRPLQKVHFNPPRPLPLPFHCAQGNDDVPEPLHRGQTCA